MLLPIATIFLFFLSLYLYYKKCFTYWKSRKIPQLEPVFPVGDLSKAAFGKESIFLRIQTLYHRFKDGGHKFGGIYFFNGPIFLPVHPDMVKRILISDFEYFVDRGVYINKKKIPLSAHIFSMKGEEWKHVRSKFTPIFTTTKIKSMYNTLINVSQTLVTLLRPVAEQELEIDMKEVSMRYSSDIIGSTAFGVDVNSLEYPETKFAKMVTMIFNHPPWKLIKILFQEGIKNPGNISKIIHDNEIVQKYFTDLVKETIEYRDKNNIKRDDFLNSLMKMRSTGMGYDEITAHSFLLFIAAFETSSSAMSYCVHELAHNQQIQDKLREEVHTLGRDSSKYTYDDILSLPYIDKCVKEILRKYPPAGILNRICVKDYQIPETDIIIKKDTPVVISTVGLQRDPEYFPNPLEFDPERFDSKNKIVPNTYIPFGDGPRNCIGIKFGLLETKLGLATLVNEFKFLPSSKSPRHLVVDPGTTSLVFNVLNGVHVKLVKV